MEALPMRLQEQAIGALNLFRSEPGPLDTAELRVGQALADIATIGLLHERNVRRRACVSIMSILPDLHVYQALGR